MNPASQSPNVSNMGQGSSNIASGYGSNSPAMNAYGGSSSSYNLQTPAYQNTMSPNTQRLIGSLAPAPVAYNPDTAGNQDSSDSDN